MLCKHRFRFGNTILSFLSSSRCIIYVLILSTSTHAPTGCQFKTGQSRWIITYMVKGAKLHRAKFAWNWKHFKFSKFNKWERHSTCALSHILYPLPPLSVIHISNSKRGLEFVVQNHRNSEMRCRLRRNNPTSRQHYKYSRTAYLRRHSIVYQPVRPQLCKLISKAKFSKNLLSENLD